MNKNGSRIFDVYEKKYEKFCEERINNFFINKILIERYKENHDKF